MTNPELMNTINADGKAYNGNEGALWVAIIFSVIVTSLIVYKLAVFGLTYFNVL